MKFQILAAGLSAILPFVAAAPYAVGAEAVDVEILQYALTLEHLENKFYADALAKFSADDFRAAGYPAQVRQRLVQVGGDEAVHVATLEAVLTAAGATPTEPCVYNFPYTDVTSFLGLSRVLEGVGVTAYLYKSQFINNKQYLVAAASILSVEARHQALVSSFLGQDGAPNPFDTPLTGSEVLTLATPFLKSCPKSNYVLPFKSFPALTVNTAAPAAGKSVSFTYPKQSGDVYIHFINGLSDFAVKVDGNGNAALPADVTGTIYAIASSSADRPNDDTTIAGPAIIILENPDATYADAKARRAISFDA